MLEQNGVVPTNVFYCHLDDQDIIKRNLLSVAQHAKKIGKIMNI
jgi:hypothetical protein